MLIAREGIDPTRLTRRGRAVLVQNWERAPTVRMLLERILTLLCLELGGEKMLNHYLPPSKVCDHPACPPDRCRVAYHRKRFEAAHAR